MNMPPPPTPTPPVVGICPRGARIRASSHRRQRVCREWSGQGVPRNVHRYYRAELRIYHPAGAPELPKEEREPGVPPTTRTPRAPYSDAGRHLRRLVFGLSDDLLAPNVHAG